MASTGIMMASDAKVLTMVVGVAVLTVEVMAIAMEVPLLEMNVKDKQIASEGL
jgi:hypothetical protein